MEAVPVRGMPKDMTSMTTVGNGRDLMADRVRDSVDSCVESNFDQFEAWD